MKLKPGYQLLLLLCATLSIYYPAIFIPFNSLDDQALVNHLLNQEGFSLARHFAPGGLYDYYRPLLTLTFEIDKHVGGLQEPFMHLVNVLTHALNVALLWLLARAFGRLVGNGSELLPFVAALLFALHPLNSEAVNWIMGRADLLAGTFVFAASYALLRYLAGGAFIWGILSAVALLGGALCKETALFLLPAACFLLICRPPKGRLFPPQRWSLIGLYGVAVTAYFLLRREAFQVDRGLGHTAQLAASAVGLAPSPGAAPATPAATDFFPWLDAVRVALKASGFYAVKLFQPLPLNFAIHRVDPFYLLPGIVLAALLLFLFWRRRVQEWPFLASASIAVSALFVLFTGLAWTPIAERYMYIPCGPFVVGMAYLVDNVSREARWRPLLPLFVLLLLGVSAWATVTRTLVWQDNLTLYEDTVRKSPDFPPARNQLAFALREHGRNEEALTILGDNVVSDVSAAVLNRASAYWETGNYNAARRELLNLLQKHKDLELKILDALVGITMVQAQKTEDERLKRGYYEDILLWLKRMYVRWPNGFVTYRIGRVYLLMEDREQAQRAFADAAAQLPPESMYKEPAAKLARTLAK